MKITGLFLALMMMASICFCPADCNRLQPRGNRQRIGRNTGNRRN